MAGHRDLGYKYLFAHPELVRDLLADFTEFGSLAALDLCAFERVNPGYVSDRFSERQDDIVWRVKLGEQWCYIYILLEFQSGLDRWMALRMQVYIGLLYQDLIKRRELAPDSLLPPVLPLVLYNGVAVWTAATELATLIAQGPGHLASFQAQQRYVLVDQHRLDPAALAAKRSVLALLFRLELSEAPNVILDVLPLLGAWLREDAQAPLRRSVAAWVEQLLVRQFHDPAAVASLVMKEGGDMGARRFETWYEYVEDQGIQKGVQRGIAQGIEQGIEQGRQRVAGQLADALEALLRKRFGSVPPSAQTMLQHASVDDLVRWMAQASEAPSIDMLLGPSAAQ